MPVLLKQVFLHLALFSIKNLCIAYDPARQSPAPANPPPAATDGEARPAAKIIGNKNSKVYHLPGCSSYGRVSEKNQVLFDTAEEAEKAGFRLASNCSAKKTAKE
jgi:hypothetical protein